MTSFSELRVSVIGTGYLGTTHAACLAELGFDVVGVDQDTARIASLADGRLPFAEPGLQELLTRHVASGRLRFTTDLAEAARSADVHFLCVGTPQRDQSGAADVSAVFGAARALAPLLVRDALVVGKSTVPVGTTAILADEIEELAPEGVRVDVAWNPEFLREGHAVRDTLQPDRLVLGVTSPAAELTLRAVYADPIAAGVPVHVADPATAELAKVSANSFLATKISFVNALAEVSDRVGADVTALADILGDDPRIGRRFLDAGIGFGGGCLPKDIRAFGARSRELGVPAVAELLHHVDEINLAARRRTVQLATQLCGGRLWGRRVAVLGAAFKPFSDDIRDSPALDIAEALHALGGSVRVFDPAATVTARAACPQLHHVDDVEQALRGADLVLHLTEWPQFRELDPAWAASLVRCRQVIDGRNRLDHERWRLAGWTFHGLGRGAQPAAVHRARVPVPAPAPAGLGAGTGAGPG